MTYSFDVAVGSFELCTLTSYDHFFYISMFVAQLLSLHISNIGLTLCPTMKKFYGCCSLTSFLLWLILKNKKKIKKIMIKRIFKPHGQVCHLWLKKWIFRWHNFMSFIKWFPYIYWLVSITPIHQTKSEHFFFSWM